MTTESFPRLAARTMNFRLGLPRSFTVSRDGRRIVFLRAPDGVTRAHGLWIYDVAEQSERIVVDPDAVLEDGTESLTDAERARRERMRVGTSGVVAYSTDREVARAAFALSSRLFVVDLTGAEPPREYPTQAAVVDPRLDPTGRRVAYVGDRSLRMITLDTGVDDLLVGPNAGEPAEVAWGLAEFVAAEELNRDRGFWWSPDGASLLVERYDESAVQTWYLSEPADPDRPPVPIRYPRAGTANAVVGLAVVTPGADRVEVDWRSDVPLDGCTLEYLVDVEWSGARPVLTLLTRDQRRMEYRELDPATGRTALMRAVTDEAWVELLPGTPRRLSDGRLLHSVDRDEMRRIWLDDEPATPPDVLLREVVSVADDSVLAEIVPAIGSVGLARLHFDGKVEVLSDPSGIASGAAANSTLVVSQQRPDTLDVITEVFRGGLSAGTVRSVAAKSPIIARPRTWQVGPRGLPATVLFPTGRVPGSGRLPVLMDPYGGPHGQRVLNAARSYLTPQWFADQGFIVIVADGRGMAGRGPVWDRLAKNDRIGAIDDQVEVLADVAREYRDDLDLTRVAIRGWSFGGYLAALGVLRHPDVFAAAVAGAPTTDERLYDTCYSERYLGHPDTNADVYDANSLLPLAPTLHRPLLIIHGFADDNVHVAHSLRLSRALLATGRPHEVLPLSGSTHLANDEVVAENLLLLQLDFLRRALRIDP